MPWKVTYGHNFLCFIFKVTGIIIICVTCVIEVSVRLVCGGSRLEMQKLTAHGIPHDLIKFLFLSNGCTIKYSKKMLKFTLKLTLKVLLHVSV